MLSQRQLHNQRAYQANKQRIDLADANLLDKWPRAYQCMEVKRRCVDGRGETLGADETDRAWVPIMTPPDIEEPEDGEHPYKLKLDGRGYNGMPWLELAGQQYRSVTRNIDAKLVNTNLAHLIRPRILGSGADGAMTISIASRVTVSVTGIDLHQPVVGEYIRHNTVYITSCIPTVVKEKLADDLVSELFPTDTGGMMWHLVSGLVQAMATGQLVQRSGRYYSQVTGVSVANSHITDVSTLNVSRITRGSGILASERMSRRTVRSTFQPSTSKYMVVKRYDEVAKAVMTIKRLYPEISAQWARYDVDFDCGSVAISANEDIFVRALARLLGSVDEREMVLSCLMQNVLAYYKVEPLSTEGLLEDVNRHLYYPATEEYGEHFLQECDDSVTVASVMEIVAAQILTAEVTLTRATNAVNELVPGEQYCYKKYLDNLRQSMDDTCTRGGRADMPGVPLDLYSICTTAVNFEDTMTDYYSDFSYWAIPLHITGNADAKIRAGYRSTKEVVTSTNPAYVSLRTMIEANRVDVAAHASEISSENSEKEFEVADGEIISLKDAMMPRPTLGALARSIHWADKLSWFDPGVEGHCRIINGRLEAAAYDAVAIASHLKMAKLELAVDSGHKLGVVSNRHEYSFYTRSTKQYSLPIYESADRVFLHNGRANINNLMTWACQQTKSIPGHVVNLRFAVRLVGLNVASGIVRDLRTQADIRDERDTRLIAGCTLSPQVIGLCDAGMKDIVSHARVAIGRLINGVNVSTRGLRTRRFTMQRILEYKNGKVYWPRMLCELGQNVYTTVAQARSWGMVIPAKIFAMLNSTATDHHWEESVELQQAGVTLNVLLTAQHLLTKSPKEAGDAGEIMAWFSALGLLSTLAKLVAVNSSNVNYGSSLPTAIGFLGSLTCTMDASTDGLAMWIATLAAQEAMGITGRPRLAATVVANSLGWYNAMTTAPTGTDFGPLVNDMIKDCFTVTEMRICEPSGGCLHALRCDVAGGEDGSHTCLLCKRLVACTWCQVRTGREQAYPAERAGDYEYENAEPYVVKQDTTTQFMSDEDFAKWASDEGVTMDWAESDTEATTFTSAEGEHYDDDDGGGVHRPSEGEDAYDEEDTAQRIIHSDSEDEPPRRDSLDKGKWHAGQCDGDYVSDAEYDGETDEALNTEEDKRVDRQAWATAITVEPEQAGVSSSAMVTALAVAEPRTPVPAPHAQENLVVSIAAAASKISIKSGVLPKPKNFMPVMPDMPPGMPQAQWFSLKEKEKFRQIKEAVEVGDINKLLALGGERELYHCELCKYVARNMDKHEKKFVADNGWLDTAHRENFAEWILNNQELDQNFDEDWGISMKVKEWALMRDAHRANFAIIPTAMVQIQLLGWGDLQVPTRINIGRLPYTKLWCGTERPASKPLELGVEHDINVRDYVVDGWYDPAHVTYCEFDRDESTYFANNPGTINPSKSSANVSGISWAGPKQFAIWATFTDTRKESEKNRAPLALDERIAMGILCNWDLSTKGTWMYVSGHHIGDLVHARLRVTDEPRGDGELNEVAQVEIIHVCVSNPPPTSIYTYARMAEIGYPREKWCNWQENIKKSGQLERMEASLPKYVPDDVDTEDDMY
ncbi:hypothetical protein [Rosellinia necatrix quadrivirus 1]|uniref:Uncharacterized protein n=1 Tax=Rosellinia necatrix quadrivirus 1 TaxID=1000373 RepID=H1ACC5_RNQV1|nr:hypothetical protein [Rosellinia necatrix quadrivirus 1]BAL46423.1 hypothetical protein [Rosellinia necatrix quadrivirus 1]